MYEEIYSNVYWLEQRQSVADRMAQWLMSIQRSRHLCQGISRTGTAPWAGVPDSTELYMGGGGKGGGPRYLISLQSLRNKTSGHAETVWSWRVIDFHQKWIDAHRDGKRRNICAGMWVHLMRTRTFLHGFGAAASLLMLLFVGKTESSSYR